MNTKDWYLETDYHSEVFLCAAILNKDGELMAGFLEGEPSAETIGEFILKGIKSHEALVGALKRISGVSLETWNANDTLKEVKRIAQTALKLAEKKL